jgi:hypothetical protein
MTRDKDEDSKYTFIKKWYQETEKKMDDAWRKEGKGFDINAVEQVMFTATSGLISELAPDIDIYTLNKVQQQFMPFLKAAREEFSKQKEGGNTQRFTREDGIFPEVIQSFFHKIAKWFRNDNPTVADLMEDAAKIVYQDAKENGAKYTNQRKALEEFEEVSRKKQEREDATFRLQSTPQEIAERDVASKRLQAIFDKDTKIGSPDSTPSSSSAPTRQNTRR